MNGPFLLLKTHLSDNAQFHDLTKSCVIFPGPQVKNGGLLGHCPSKLHLHPSSL